MTLSNSKKWLGAVLLFAALVAVFDFSVLGVYQKQYGDTRSYVDMIRFYSGKGAPQDPAALLSMQARLLKPVYGYAGAAISPWLSPENSILILNLIFYFGIVALLFLLFRELSFTDGYAALGTLWFITAYPVLKYCFALLTDLGGYFFAVLTILMFIRAVKKQRLWIFLLAGLLSGLGFATKETGGMGMLFGALYLLANYKQIGLKKTLIYFLVSFVPFAAIGILAQYQASIISGYSFLNWLGSNEQTYKRNLISFLGTMLSAFNLLWVFFVYGLFHWKRWQNRKAFLCLIPPGLTVLAWPVFISRILFFQFIFIFPIALSGFQSAIEKLGIKNRVTKLALGAVPCAINLILFYLAGSGSLFKTLGL
ncbi:MAG: glycosyltransferase family 39 protein [Patescibacteria group bacterium]|nr:glycosyltransferase family 39 protein [Patescibacteria group bacterium]